MSPTTVVNLRKEPYDVYIGRAGKGKDGYFGNPFTLDLGMTREEVMAEYREYFPKKLARDPEFKRRILDLAGKRLGCFCKPELCHGDVIAEYVNNYVES